MFIQPRETFPLSDHTTVSVSFLDKIKQKKLKQANLFSNY